jgi:hypothetical protein
MVTLSTARLSCTLVRRALSAARLLRNSLFIRSMPALFCSREKRVMSLKLPMK